MLHDDAMGAKNEEMDEAKLAFEAALRGSFGSPIEARKTPLEHIPAFESTIAAFSSGEIFIARSRLDLAQTKNGIAMMKRFLQEHHHAVPRGPYHLSINQIQQLNAITEQRKILLAEQSDENLVNQVLDLVREARNRRATDIHLCIDSQGGRIELRIDKQLHYLRDEDPHKLDRMIRATHAYASQTDSTYTAQTNQDGYIDNQLGANRLPEDILGLRISKTPTVNNKQYLAIRIQTRSVFTAGAPEERFRAIGLHSRQIEAVNRAIRRPGGMTLITAPMGHGKTTLLHVINSIRAEGPPPKRVMALEQPVEGEIPGVVQQSIANPPDESERNTAFNNALRGALRSDADTISVGEIRDETTARIAYRGVESGHQIFTTLHTLSAYGTTDRLRDLGVPPWLYANSDYTCGMIAVRLTPRLCPRCAIQDTRPSPDIFRLLEACELAVSEANFRIPNPDLRNSKCPHCHGTGRHGLVLTAEVIEPDEEFFVLSEGDNPMLAKRKAMHHWVKNRHGLPMLRHALEHAADGQISLADINERIIRLDVENLYTRI